MVILSLKSSTCVWLVFSSELSSSKQTADLRSSSHLGLPGPLQLPLAVGLLVVQGQRLPAGGRRRPQAGAVAHREAQCDEDPRGREAVQEGRGQPVVLHPLVLVDVADLEGPYELPLVIQDADLVPLGETERVTCSTRRDGRTPGASTCRGLHSAG